MHYATPEHSTAVLLLDIDVSCWDVAFYAARRPDSPPVVVIRLLVADNRNDLAFTHWDRAGKGRRVCPDDTPFRVQRLQAAICRRGGLVVVRNEGRDGVAAEVRIGAWPRRKVNLLRAALFHQGWSI